MVHRSELVLYYYCWLIVLGVTCEFATRDIVIGGLVLQSAYLSIMRVVNQKFSIRGVDMFVNVDKMDRIRFPTLVIHGKKDRLIYWKHGKILHQRARNPVPPLFIEGFGHRFLEMRCKDIIIPRLKEFFIEVQNWNENLKIEVNQNNEENDIEDNENDIEELFDNDNEIMENQNNEENSIDNNENDIEEILVNQNNEENDIDDNENDIEELLDNDRKKIY